MNKQIEKLIKDAKKVYVDSNTAYFSIENYKLLLRNKFTNRPHPFQKDGDEVLFIQIGKSDLVTVKELIK